MYSKLKFVKEVNKLNERVSQMSGRNPDDNMKNKTWAEWCATAEVTLELADEMNSKNKKAADRLTSKKK